MVLKNHLRNTSLFIGVITALALVVFMDIPGNSKYVSVIQNSGHAPAFACIAFFVLKLISLRDGGEFSAARFLKQVYAAFFITIMLGVGTEFGQWLLRRDAEIDDVIQDAIGALCALTFSTYVTYRRHNQPLFLWQRALAISIVTVTLIVMITPLAVCVAAYRQRQVLFPTLARFQSSLDEYFIDASDSIISISEVPVGLRHFSGETALLTRLGTGPWPGITLSEPRANWSGYKELAIDISNPGDQALPLTIRIDDLQHEGDYNDRFNQSFVVEPHTRITIRIKSELMAHAPHRRRMDLNAISNVLLFHKGPAANKSFLLHRVGLE